VTGTAERDDARDRYELRAWARDVLDPALVGLVDTVILELGPALRAWGETLGAAGLLAPHWPVEVCGRGLGFEAAARTYDELARVGAPRPPGLAGVTRVGPLLLGRRGEGYAREILSAIASGASTWCVARGDRLEVTGTAGGGLVLRGATRATALAHIADHVLVEGHPRGSIIVDISSDGVRIERLRGPGGEVDRAVVHFADAPIPSPAVIDSGTRREGHLLASIWDAASNEARARALGSLVRDRGATAVERSAVASALWEARVLRGQLWSRLDAPADELGKRLRTLRLRIASLAADLLGADALLLPPNAPYAGTWAVETLLATAAAA
jgi:alkylation response protein AidB-like acyl-CoA dehydrogenase